MNNIRKIYNKMSDDNALFILGMFGNALMIYALMGLFCKFLNIEFAITFLVAGIVNATIAIILLFKKYDCFIHEIKN